MRWKKTTEPKAAEDMNLADTPNASCKITRNTWKHTGSRNERERERERESGRTRRGTG